MHSEREINEQIVKERIKKKKKMVYITFKICSKIIGEKCCVDDYAVSLCSNCIPVESKPVFTQEYFNEFNNWLGDREMPLKKALKMFHREVWNA